MSFNKLGLSPGILRTCQKIKYQRPTPIQALSIPSILKGESVIANAETGSGKTAAFGLPLIHQLAKDPFSIFAMIITPSRQLAMQISQQLSIFGQSISLRQALIIGGVPFSKQTDQLQAYPHIIVGTPGRVRHMLDKCQKFKQDMQRLEILVLDEADRLFQESLMDDMQFIIQSAPQIKQIILATATIDQNFEGKKLQKILGTKVDFVKHSTYEGIKTVNAANLTQNHILTPQHLKPCYLLKILQDNSNMKVIVFVKTCKQATIMAQTLKNLNYKAVSLHSFLRFSQRVTNLGMFRTEQVNILITTDLTSRGLDINNVNVVINYHMPRKVSDYIHRVGRTARNGYDGQAISLVTENQWQLFLQIQENIGAEISELPMRQNLDNLSIYNKTKRETKIHLMSSGILTELDKKFDEKRKKKLDIKNQKIQRKQQERLS